MLQAPERDGHAQRLSSLAHRFRYQERWMTAALQDLQRRLEETHRLAFGHQISGTAQAEAMVDRCSEMELQSDDLATQLVHVRMAIAGADEELATHHQLDLTTARRRA